MSSGSGEGALGSLPASRDPRLRAAVHDYLLKERNDEVVLSFGSDYFHGARAGSSVGGVVTCAWAYWIYRRMKADQREADRCVSQRPGVRSSNVTRWVIARGLRSQPMLAVGYCALMGTTVFKATKFYLAHRRCLEFMLDDVEFAMLARMSREDPVTRELFERLCTAGSGQAPPPALPSQPPASPSQGPNSAGRTAAATRSPPSATEAFRSTMAQLRRGDDAVLAAVGGHAGDGRSSRRLPTFWDGVAVGVMGSIMDCYVPMKPVWKYYNMRFGMV